MSSIVEFRAMIEDYVATRPNIFILHYTPLTNNADTILKIDADISITRIIVWYHCEETDRFGAYTVNPNDIVEAYYIGTRRNEALENEWEKTRFIGIIAPNCRGVYREKNESIYSFAYNQIKHAIESEDMNQKSNSFMVPSVDNNHKPLQKRKPTALTRQKEIKRLKQDNDESTKKKWEFPSCDPIVYLNFFNPDIAISASRVFDNDTEMCEGFSLSTLKADMASEDGWNLNRRAKADVIRIGKRAVKAFRKRIQQQKRELENLQECVGEIQRYNAVEFDCDDWF